MRHAVLSFALGFSMLLASSNVVVAKEPRDSKSVSALTKSTWKKTFDAVVPTKAEMRWAQVDWKATLWDAVIEAHKEKKPILLWAMNGHALACT